MSVGPIQTTHTQAGAMAGAGTTDQSTKQQVPSTHKGSGGRATEKRSASDCAAVLSLEHGKVSSDRRRGVHFYICACAIMQRCPTCFRHLAGTSCGHRLRPPSHAYVFHNSYGHISCQPVYMLSLRQLMLRYRATTYLVRGNRDSYVATNMEQLTVCRYKIVCITRPPHRVAD